MKKKKWRENEQERHNKKTRQKHLVNIKNDIIEMECFMK